MFTILPVELSVPSVVLTLLTSAGLAAVVFAAILLCTARDVAEQRKSRKRADLIRQRLHEEAPARIEFREIEIRLSGQ